jgi:hypothetical protein
MVLSTQLTQKLEKYDGSSIIAVDEEDASKTTEMV